MNKFKKVIKGLFSAILVIAVFSTAAIAEQKIVSQIDIQATPEHVWSVLMDFEEYSNWSRFITSIALSSKNATVPEVGHHLAITVVPPSEEGMDFSPELLAVEKNTELRWRGNVAGMDFLFSGEHYFQLQPLGNNQTRLVHGEVFNGWLLPLLWGTISENTPAGFEAFNMAIKHRVESR